MARKLLNINEQQKNMILIAIVLLVVIYVDFSFILKFQFKSLKEGISRLKQVKSEMALYKKDSLKSQELANDLKLLEKKMANIETNIISDSDLPLFLDDISQKANFYGIKIMQIRPLRQIEDQKEKKVQGSPKSNLEFYGLPIKLELRSGYHQLGEFLSSLESNPFIWVTDLRIRYDDLEPRYHKVELDLKAYVAKK